MRLDETNSSLHSELADLYLWFMMMSCVSTVSCFCSVDKGALGFAFPSPQKNPLKEPGGMADIHRQEIADEEYMMFDWMKRNIEAIKA